MGINKIMKFFIILLLVATLNAKEENLSNTEINTYLSKISDAKYCDDFNKLPFSVQTDKEFLLKYLHKFLYFRGGLCFTEELRADKQSAKLLITHGSDRYFQTISKKLKNDLDIALHLVDVSGRGYAVLPQKLKENKQVLLKALDHMYRWEIESALKNDIPKSLLDDKEVALKIISKNNFSLKYMSNRLKKDLDVAIAALKKNGYNINYIDKTLISNEKVIQVYLSQPDVSLLELDPSLKLSKKIMYTYAKASTSNYCNLPAKLKMNKILAIESISNDFLIAECFEKSFLTKRDFAMQMVQKHGMTLQYLSKDFRNDKEIVTKAIEQNALSYLYASKHLRDDKQLTIKAVSGVGILLKNLSTAQQADKDIVLAAVRSNPLSIKFASDALKNDEEIVLQAVKKSHLALFFAGYKLRRDKAFAHKVLKVNGMALGFLFHTLMEDKQLIKEAIKQNRDALCYKSIDKYCQLDATDYIKINPYGNKPSSILEHLNEKYDNPPEVDIKLADIDGDGEKDQITVLFQKVDMRNAFAFVDIMATSGDDIRFDESFVYTTYKTSIPTKLCINITNSDWGNWSEGSEKSYCYVKKYKSWYLKSDKTYSPYVNNNGDVELGKFEHNTYEYKMNQRIDGEWLAEELISLNDFLKKVKANPYAEVDIKLINAYFKKSPLSQKNVWKYNNIAFYLKDGSSDTSIYILKKIIKMFPKRAVSYLNLADILIEVNKDDAVKYYATYVKLMKENDKESKIPKRARIMNEI